MAHCRSYSTEAECRQAWARFDASLGPKDADGYSTVTSKGKKVRVPNVCLPDGTDPRGPTRVQEDARVEGPDSARMTMLVELEEFVQDHQSHGGITGDAMPPAWNGYLLAVTCPCGVVFERWVTPEDAQEDLVRAASLN